MHSITIASEFGALNLINEPARTFGSADNVRRYQQEIELEPKARPTSVHGVLIDDEPIAVFGAGGGCGFKNSQRRAHASANESLR